MKTKMKNLLILTLLATSALTLPARGRDGTTGESYAAAAGDMRVQLENAVAELAALREAIVGEKLPLSKKLSALESELIDVRLEYKKVSGDRDSRLLGMSNLTNDLKAHQEEATYLSNLLGEYIRNFESRLHIAEVHRYKQALEAARLAPENTSLTPEEVYKAQAAMLDESLARLEGALGGDRFAGSAVDDGGLVRQGTFVILGPAALFLSNDGAKVGTAEQRLGSLEPAIIAFGDPLDAEAARTLVSGGKGLFPLDPTLGSAHKIEQTEQTLAEHISKGGPVMAPILAMAGLALLVAIYKWIHISTMVKPSPRRVNDLLAAVAGRDAKAIGEAVGRIRGPVGRMLAAGVEHLREPRELIEEIMYEKVLSTRLKLQKMLPFIAICAASAPLLGLLGTVTGIINTFKLINVFGSGDVKTLSGGISEALITTEFGLIVAIPSLLLHAFLARKARGVTDQMEQAAVSFVNQVSKTHMDDTAAAGQAVIEPEDSKQP